MSKVAVNTERLIALIPKDLMAGLRRAADKGKVSQAEIVRLALETYLTKPK